MKKKIILCFGMLFGFSIALMGCNSTAPFELSTVSKTELPIDSGTSGGLTASGVQYFDNTFDGFSQEQGYYRVVNSMDESNSTRISYIDYNSKVEIPLCNQPQCSHDTEKCQAMFYGDQHMNSQVFPMGDKIYVLASKNAFTEDLGIEDGGIEGGFGLQMELVTYSTALYEMNRDGTNRSEMLEIGAEYEVHNVIVSGLGKILLSAVKLVPDAVVAESVILQVDVSSRELSELKIQGNMLGVVGDSVVISQTGYGDLTGMSDSEAMSRINHSNSKIVTYNIKTRETKEHGEVSSNDLMDCYVYNQRLIYTPCRNAIYYKDLDTNESGTIVDQLSGRFFMVSKGDGKVVCAFDDGADVNAKITNFLKVDCETGETSDFTLFTRQSVDKHGVAILGASDTQYLVKSDLIEVSEYIEWAGVNQVSIIGDGFSLINKEDYWASKDNYEPITALE